MSRPVPDYAKRHAENLRFTLRDVGVDYRGPAAYVVRVVGGPALVKIGHTSNLGRRMAQLSLGSPLPLKLVAALNDYAGDLRGAVGAEVGLHALFAAHHSHGEWFAAEPVLRFLRERFAIPGDDGR